MKKNWWLAALAPLLSLCLIFAMFSGTFITYADGEFDSAKYDSYNNLALANGATHTANSFYDGNNSQESAFNKERTSGNYWQPNATDLNTNYIGIEWSSATTFDVIVLYWKVGVNPDKNEVTIKTGSKTTAWESLLTISQEYTYTKYSSVKGNSGTEYQVSVIELSSAITTERLALNVSAKFDSCGDVAAQMMEFEVYNTDVAVYDLKELSKVFESANGRYPDDNNIYGFSTETWNIFTTARSSAGTALTDCDKDNPKPVGSVSGYADQTAIDDITAALQAALDNLHEYDTSTLASLVANVNNAYPADSGNKFGFTGESWNALTDARSAATTALGVCTRKALGSAANYADQAALDAVTVALSNAVAGLTRTSVPAGNVLLGSPMYFNPNELDYSWNINFAAITDGSYRDDGYCWQNKRINNQTYVTETSAIVKLANAATINEVVLVTEQNPYSATGISVYYTTADLSGITDYDSILDLGSGIWTKAGRYGPDKGGVSYTSTDDSYYKVQARLDDHGRLVNSFTFDAVQNVTGLMFTDSYGQYKIFEAEAYYNTVSVDNKNTEETKDDEITATNTFTGMEDYNNGSDMAIVLTNISQEAATGYRVRVTGKIKRTSGEKVESTSINTIASAAYGSVTFTVNSVETTFTSGSFEGGHLGDYVTGVLFTGLDYSSYTYDFSELTFSLEAIG